MFKPVLKSDGVFYPVLVDLTPPGGVAGMVLPGEGSHFCDGGKVAARQVHDKKRFNNDARNIFLGFGIPDQGSGKSVRDNKCTPYTKRFVYDLWRKNK